MGVQRLENLGPLFPKVVDGEGWIVEKQVLQAWWHMSVIPATAEA
jgi:hypothetical protein